MFDEKVLPLMSFCQLLMNADVRFGASRIWSIETLPMLRLPAAAPAVAPATIDCRPERPPTSAVPKVSIRLSAAQAMNGMLIAR